MQFLVDYLRRPEAHSARWGDDRCHVYLEACVVLGRESEKHDLASAALDVLERLAPLPTAEGPAGRVFVSVPGEDPEIVYNVPVPGMTVFPGKQHRLHSDPGEYTLARAKASYSSRSLGRVRVTGKSRVVEVLEVFADKSREDFEKGLALYFGRDFAESSVFFNNILKHNPLDAAASLYLKKAADYMVRGVPEDWE